MITNFKNESHKLFDIRQCKNSPDSCQCNYCSILPQKVKTFIIDQLGPRNQVIPRNTPRITPSSSTTIDQLSISGITSTPIDQPSTSETCYNETQMMSSVSSSSSSSSLLLNENTMDKTFVPEEISVKNKSERNMKKIPNLAKTCVRFNATLEVAAAIFNSGLMDYGIFDKHNAIDASKIRRAIEKEQLNVLARQEKNKRPLIGLGFDGKIDLSAVMEHGRTIQAENHYTMVQEPGSHFLGFVTIKKELDSETQGAELIFNTMLERLLENDNLEDLKVLCNDGTYTNTGRLKGICTRFETFCERPLQRFVCLLHCVELPLRKLILTLDGRSLSGEEFSGSIGKLLYFCFVLFNNLIL